MIWYILYSILISIVFPIATWIYLIRHDKMALLVPEIHEEMYFINYMFLVGWFFYFRYIGFRPIVYFVPAIWLGINLLLILLDTLVPEKRNLRVILLQIGFSLLMLVPLLFVL